MIRPYGRRFTLPRIRRPRQPSKRLQDSPCSSLRARKKPAVAHWSSTSSKCSIRGVGSSKCGSGPPEPHHLTIPPLRECLNPQAAASKPSHSTRKPHHQTHRSPNTTSQPLVASPHHAPNHSCSEPPGGARAGANSGAANGSFIARSTRSIESGSWIAASSRRAPPQHGHVNTATPNARLSNSAQV